MTFQPCPNTTNLNYPRYEAVWVDLVGKDGNAFAIIGRVKAALRQGGVSSEEIANFVLEATSGDYDNLLATCMRWVVVDEADEEAES